MTIDMDFDVLARMPLVAKETNKFGQKEANTFQNNVIYKNFQTIVWIITRKSFILTTSLFFRAPTYLNNAVKQRLRSIISIFCTTFV